MVRSDSGRFRVHSPAPRYLFVQTTISGRQLGPDSSAPTTTKAPGTTRAPGTIAGGMLRDYRRRDAPHQITTRPTRTPTARTGDANASAVRARPGSYVGPITGQNVAGRVGTVAGQTTGHLSTRNRQTRATRAQCKRRSTVRASLV